MLPLPMPTDTARDTYLLCISRISKDSVKKRMLGLEDAVADAADLYAKEAAAATLHTLHTQDFTPQSSQDRDQMIRSYTSRMAKTGAPGRPVYDRLKLATSRCTLCGHRDVSTLDHHLPKTAFPMLSVAPANLVPACSDCNRAKLDASSATAAEQTLHPYFDNVDQDVWLKAEVIQGTAPALVFSADPPRHWPVDLTDRVRHHFEVFGLADLYGSQAAAELAEISYALQQLHAAGGEQTVKDHLDLQAISRGRARRNSWQAAAYRSLADSSWYCSGGFAVT